MYVCFTHFIYPHPAFTTPPYHPPPYRYPACFCILVVDVHLHCATFPATAFGAPLCMVWSGSYNTFTRRLIRSSLSAFMTDLVQLFCCLVVNWTLPYAACARQTGIRFAAYMSAWFVARITHSAHTCLHERCAHKDVVILPSSPWRRGV